MTTEKIRGRHAIGGLHMMVVGLTGGIATGKTTVADMLRVLGARVIDADRIAHEVTAPGKPAWQAIRAVFGQNVLQADNAIDRKRLGALVFNDPSLRKQLEQIVHPLVRARIEEQVEQCRRADPHGLVVQDVPLLIETGAHTRFAEVILVYVSPDIQLQRLIRRDGLTPEEARARIAAQMPIDAKRELATIVIDNSGLPADTRSRVRQVYETLIRRAREENI